MVERLVKEADGLVDAKLSEINKVLTDSALDKMHGVQGEDHLRHDVDGIREALRGHYKEAARIFAAESKVNGDAEVRSYNTSVVALANTMHAVSLLKLNDREKLAEAESLLKSERVHDIAGENEKLNKVLQVKDLNKSAYRLALLKLGKHADVKYSDMLDEIAGVANIHGLSKEWFADTIKAKNAQINKNGLDMAKKQDEMIRTFDEARRRKLMQEQTDICNSTNADKIILLQTLGMQAAVCRNNAEAEKYFKAAFNVIDQDDRLRIPGRRDNSVVSHVDPEMTQVASTLYAFCLAEQKKFAEAEERFAKEIQRDKAGLNSSDSTVMKLNQLGLEFVQLMQGKAKTAKVPFQPKVVEMMPAPRAVMR